MCIKCICLFQTRDDLELGFFRFICMIVLNRRLMQISDKYECRTNWILKKNRDFQSIFFSKSAIENIKLTYINLKLKFKSISQKKILLSLNTIISLLFLLNLNINQKTYYINSQKLHQLWINILILNYYPEITYEILCIIYNIIIYKIHIYAINAI